LAATSAFATGGQTLFPTHDTCTDFENGTERSAVMADLCPMIESLDLIVGRKTLRVEQLARGQHAHADIDNDERHAVDLDSHELALIPEAIRPHEVGHLPRPRRLRFREGRHVDDSLDMGMTLLDGRCAHRLVFARALPGSEVRLQVGHDELTLTLPVSHRGR